MSVFGFIGIKPLNIFGGGGVRAPSSIFQPYGTCKQAIFNIVSVGA